MYHLGISFMEKRIMKKIYALLIMLLGLNVYAASDAKEVVLDVSDENNETLSADQSGLRYVISAEQLDKLVEDGVVSTKKSGSSTDCGGGGEWGK
jgi:hypothetical protein